LEWQVLNAVIGFVQETRAESALNSLQDQLKVMARVLRDGDWVLLPARELVPGDIVRLRHGDVVPADVIVLEGDLMADQSALTGESDAVLVKSNEEAYSGSIVRNGEAMAVVNHIALATKFGKTIQLVSTSAPKLHVEIIIGRVVWALLIMAGVLIGTPSRLEVIR
jgi:H+-transporting ATPase